MTLNSNIAAVKATRYYGMHQNNIAKSMMRLSSGKRINSAADDPAGMAIAQKIRMQIRELRVNIRNEEMYQDTLNAAYDQSKYRSDLLGEMREIAVRMSTGTLTQEDMSALSMQYTQLLEELTQGMLKGTGLEIIAIESGNMAGEFLFVRGDKVYMDGKWVDFSLAADGAKLTSAKSMLSYVDSLFKSNMSSAAQFSAMASRIDYKLNRLFAQEENATEALSRIEDVDMAKEILNLTRESLLSQCALAMVAQANSTPENVLYLLESL